MAGEGGRPGTTAPSRQRESSTFAG